MWRLGLARLGLGLGLYLQLPTESLLPLLGLGSASARPGQPYAPLAGDLVLAIPRG